MTQPKDETEHQNLQLVPFNQDVIVKDERSSLMSVTNNAAIARCFALTLNPEFPYPAVNEEVLFETLSNAVIVIPPSSSDLSEASVQTTPSTTVNIQLNMTTHPTKIQQDEPLTSLETVTMDSVSSADASMTTVATTTDHNVENTPPPKQLKRSDSFGKIANKGVDFEEDTFDRIRKASAGMAFQGKHNPRLKTEHRHSFGHTIANVEWFHGNDGRRCPRGGWLTRMAKGENGNKEMMDADTPAHGVFRTTNGFTFQC